MFNLSKPASQASKHFFVVGIIWLLLQFYFLARFGIVTDFEASKYIEQANSLISSGSYTSKNFLFYSTEIFLITLCKKLQVGYWPVILIQLAVNAFSMWCFYRLVFYFTNKKTVALGFCIAFLAMFYYHLYNVYLFTESVYFSFSIIYTYVLFQTKNFSFKRSVFLLAFITLLYFTRPVGLFFLPATILFLLLKFYKRPSILPLIFLTTPVVIFIYFLINNSLNSGGEFDFLLPYSEEHVICGVPTVTTPQTFINPFEPNSIEGIWFIISTHGELFFRLGVQRLSAFFGMIRTYYSLSHNLFVAFYFYTLYLVILFGLRKMFHQWRAQMAFLLILVFFTTLTVALSCDEWHNRFMFAILPFLLLLATGTFLKKGTLESTPLSN